MNLEPETNNCRINPKALPVQKKFDTTPAPSVKIIGTVIVLSVAVLYVIFW